MYSNVLRFSVSKDRIKITQKLVPTFIFLDQCNSSELPLIASPRNVTAAYWQQFASLVRFYL